MARAINFFSEDTTFQLKQKRLLIRWIIDTIIAYKHEAGDINFIYCSDDYLLQINKKFLKHDFYTDIITFPNLQKGIISGDIFISIDRVKENANAYKGSFSEELHRVMIHGILHLLGYKDKRKADALAMRRMENKMLSLRPF